MMKIINAITDRGMTVIGCIMDDKQGVVLVKRNTDHHPYVTWRCNNEGDTFHGNYFASEEEAIEDFIRRATYV